MPRSASARPGNSGRHQDLAQPAPSDRGRNGAHGVVDFDLGVAEDGVGACSCRRVPRDMRRPPIWRPSGCAPSASTRAAVWFRAQAVSATCTSPRTRTPLSAGLSRPSASAEARPGLRGSDGHLYPRGPSGWHCGRVPAGCWVHLLPADRTRCHERDCRHLHRRPPPRPDGRARRRPQAAGTRPGLDARGRRRHARHPAPPALAFPDTTTLLRPPRTRPDGAGSPTGSPPRQVRRDDVSRSP